MLLPNVKTTLGRAYAAHAYHNANSDTLYILLNGSFREEDRERIEEVFLLIPRHIFENMSEYLAPIGSSGKGRAKGWSIRTARKNRVIEYPGSQVGPSDASPED